MVAWGSLASSIASSSRQERHKGSQGPSESSPLPVGEAGVWAGGVNRGEPGAPGPCWPSEVLENIQTYLFPEAGRGLSRGLVAKASGA